MVKVTKTDNSVSASLKMNVFVAIVLGIAIAERFLGYHSLVTPFALFISVVYTTCVILGNFALLMTMWSFTQKQHVVRVLNAQNISVKVEDLPINWAQKFTPKFVFHTVWPMVMIYLAGFNKTVITLVVVTFVTQVLRDLLNRQITKA
jgi:hypothetical protein